MQLSENAIITLIDSIFEKPSPMILEAYSDFDKEPMIFDTPKQLSIYINSELSKPKGLAYFYVIYPDMLGQPIKKLIHINSKKMPNCKFRYTWLGWGLISVQLASPDLGIASSINANTEKRAMKWSSTLQDIPPPSSWDWSAVELHKKRLQRAFKKVA